MDGMLNDRRQSVRNKERLEKNDFDQKNVDEFHSASNF